MYPIFGGKCPIEQLKSACFGDNGSDSQENWYFLEIITSLVGKGGIFERMLVFLGERSIYF